MSRQPSHKKQTPRKIKFNYFKELNVGRIYYIVFISFITSQL